MTASASDLTSQTLAPALVEQATRTLLTAAPAASAVAVALHRKGRRALLVRGHTMHHVGQPITSATRFEIGSLTKTFTALLLAEQAARGLLGHKDPLALHLPADTELPPQGSAITLTHLATHTSGLPNTPPGLHGLLTAFLHTPLVQTPFPPLLTTPYAAFTTGHALRALAQVRLHARPGTRFLYSNYAVGLLGHALAHTTQMSFPDLAQARVMRPLRLQDTNCATTPSTATGYWRHRAQPPLHIPGLLPSGAMRASVRDLLTLAEALLDPASAAGIPSTLRSALYDVQRPRLRRPRSPNLLGLVWNIRPRPDGSTVHYHTGGTFGFTAFVGFNSHHGTAVIALANTAASRRNDLVQQAYNTLLTLHR
ncbi:serine hydrolase domain-containing protein [Streptomyces flaveolus]|uniref:serine hydrolase domain-containing protein n=1 Tax=Streptomyces flaveolus TaxID=67297 RepID=UPI003447B578